MQRKIARAELSRRAFIVTIAVLATSVVAALLALTLAIRQAQTDGTPTGKRIVALQETISDCVDPTGECYQRSQKRQAGVVATLNLGALYAIYCVDRNPQADIAEVQRCVQRLYDNDQPGEQGG